jgi:hypothetical protein
VVVVLVDLANNEIEVFPKYFQEILDGILKMQPKKISHLLTLRADLAWCVETPMDIDSVVDFFGLIVS